MAIVVRPSISGSSAACTRRSELVSRLDVASSRIRIRGSFRITRAMASRCFSPPESLYPRSPTIVSYPSASSTIRSWMFAARAAASSSSWVASGFP